MDNDIVPALLETISKDFDEQTIKSLKLKKALVSLKNKQASYLDVNDFAIETGEILANVLSTNITSAVLPEGKMHYNIADRLLNPTMKKNHALISSFAVDVQTGLNHAAGLRIKSQKPELNQNRIDGLVNKISNSEEFEDVKWLLAEPMINFSQSIADDTIKANADFHVKSGLRPKLIRRVSGHACKWCQNLAGSYDYGELPDDIYRRHERCRCTVDYVVADGKRQNVWSKKWDDPQRKQKKENRKAINFNENSISNKVFDQTNMKKMIGNKDYKSFLESLDSIEESSVKTLFQKFGSQLEFNEISDSKDYVSGKKVQLSKKAFKGTQNKAPMQGVYHELGHAIDNLGIEVLGSDFERTSEMPSYKLKNDIKKDLTKLFNSDLESINGDNHEQLKNLKKMSIFDQSSIVRKYKKLAAENPKAYSALSDMMESTGAFIDHPLGSGHGLNYWKVSGMQEAEFFAHMAETVVNEDARKMMYELFPSASKKWEKMIEDILNGVK